MPERLCAIILVRDEQLHLARCLDSLRDVADKIVVVDSGSTDDSREIARARGAVVLENPWINYASQFNWALANAGIDEEWCLRIDADEVLSERLRHEISRRVRGGQVSADVSGLHLHRVIVFQGRPLRWGGIGKLYMLRLFRTGRGRCEVRWMDEHIVVDKGRVDRLAGELVDENLNNIGWWTAKHNGYATREAIDLLNIRHRFMATTGRAAMDSSTQSSRKRWLKEAIYAKLPGGLRAMIYFVYRYIFLLGFLDGRAGFAFHLLQGFWYRYLVDQKVQEIERRASQDGAGIPAAIRSEYGIRVETSAEERP